MNRLRLLNLHILRLVPPPTLSTPGLHNRSLATARPPQTRRSKTHMEGMMSHSGGCSPLSVAVRVRHRHPRPKNATGHRFIRIRNRRVRLVKSVISLSRNVPCPFGSRVSAPGTQNTLKVETRATCRSPQPMMRAKRIVAVAAGGFTSRCRPRLLRSPSRRIGHRVGIHPGPTERVSRSTTRVATGAIWLLAKIPLPMQMVRRMNPQTVERDRSGIADERD